MYSDPVKLRKIAFVDSELRLKNLPPRLHSNTYFLKSIVARSLVRLEEIQDQSLLPEQDNIKHFDTRGWVRVKRIGELFLGNCFLKKPKICIFDESTSALDEETDHTIQKNIDIFLPYRTKIIITHRPFFNHQFNQVITLDKKDKMAS